MSSTTYALNLVDKFVSYLKCQRYFQPTCILTNGQCWTCNDVSYPALDLEGPKSNKFNTLSEAADSGPRINIAALGRISGGPAITAGYFN